MKTLLSFILLFSFVADNFSSPLIYRLVKTTHGREKVESELINTEKLKQVRILVFGTYDRGKTFSVEVYAIDKEDIGDEKKTFDSQSGIDYKYNLVIDSPPNQLQITTYCEGTFKIYVWGQ